MGDEYRGTIAEAKEAWVNSQKTAFTRWANNHLKKKGYSVIEDCEVDFQDGTMLMKLIHVLYGVRMPKHKKDPVSRIHKLDNLVLAFDMLKEAEIKTSFLKPEHLCDKDLKMILGMLWTIILDYAIKDINVGEATAKDGLLLWCQKNTKGYKGVDPPGLKNFHVDWKSGLAFCALINKFRPDLIDYDALDKSDAKGNLELAFSVAEKHLDIPRLLDVSDLLDTARPDERAVMTYVAEYFHCFASGNMKTKAAEKIQKFINFDREIKALIADYENRARALKEWIEGKTDWFKDPEAKIEDPLKVLENYYAGEKPEHKAEDYDVRTIFNDLQKKLAVNGREPYIPPPELTFEALDTDWKNLEDAEIVFRKIQPLITAYETDSRQLLDWANETAAKLEETPTFSSPEEALARKKEISDIINKDVPAKLEDEKKLEEILAEVHKEQTINGVPAYVPPEDLSSDALRKALESLKDKSALQFAHCDSFLVGDKMKGLEDKYEDDAKGLRSWIDDAVAKLEGVAPVSSPEEAEALRALLAQVIDSEKPEEEKKKEDLYRYYIEIQTELVMNNKDAYQPPDGLGPSDFDDAFKKLNDAAQKKKDDLDHFDKVQQLQKALDDYNARAKELIDKALDKAKSFHLSPDASPAELKAAESDLDKYRSSEKPVLLDDKSKLLEDYANLQKEAAFIPENFIAPVELSPESVNAAFKDLAAAEDKQAGLIDQVGASQAQDNLTKEYEKKAQDLVDWIINQKAILKKEKVDDFKNEKAAARAGEYAAGFVDDGKKSGDVAAKEKELDDTLGLYKKIQLDRMGAKRNPYGAPDGLGPEDLKKGFGGLKKDATEFLHATEDFVAASKAKALATDYEKRAAALLSWIKGEVDRLHGKKKLSFDDVKSARDAVENFKSYLASSKAKKEGEFFLLKAEFAETQKQRELAHKDPYAPPAELTLDSLRAAFGTLAEAEAFYTGILLEAKNEFIVRAETGISKDQIKEIESSFKHFDADGSGKMDKTEFKAATQALGVAFKDDAHFEEVFKSVAVDDNTVTKDEYMNYFIKQNEVKNDIASLGSTFDFLSEGKGYLTEDMLKTSPLTPEETEWLRTNIPKTADGAGYDYKSWVAGLSK